MMKSKKDYRIVFVNLKSPLPVMSANSRFTYEHIGIGYLTAILRQNGYVVKIVDAQTKDLSDEAIINEVNIFTPSFIGFSPVSITFENACKIAKAVKNRDDKIHICLGGQLATFAAEEILRNEPYFNLIIRGYGEETIVEVVDRLRLGKSLKGVQGVFYKGKKGEVVKNKDRSKNSRLDAVPFPARDSLKWQIENGSSPTARVITSRGCIYNCSFCSTPSFETIQRGPLWCARTSKNVLGELKYLKKHFNVKTVLFSDDNFIGPGNYGRERTREIVNDIQENRLNINFRILCRADALLNNADLIPLLKKTGLERVILGVESSCPSGLKVFNKKVSVAQNFEAVRLLRKNNIALELGFIMFHPYVTFQELKENALFLKKIDQAVSPYRFLSRVALYPGAPLISKLEEDGLLKQLDYKSPFGYNFQNPKIEILVNALGEIGSWLHSENTEKAIYNWEKHFLDAEFFLANTRHKTILEWKYERNSLSEFQENYRVLRKEVSLLNLEFFIKCVELAENKWIANIFKELKERYTQKIENANRKLSVICRDLLKGKEGFDEIC